MCCRHALCWTTVRWGCLPVFVFVFVFVLCSMCCRHVLCTTELSSAYQRGQLSTHMQLHSPLHKTPLTSCWCARSFYPFCYSKLFSRLENLNFFVGKAGKEQPALQAQKCNRGTKWERAFCLPSCQGIIWGSRTISGSNHKLAWYYGPSVSPKSTFFVPRLSSECWMRPFTAKGLGDAKSMLTLLLLLMDLKFDAGL